MPEILSLSAREILDSRGDPTVEVDIELAGGAHGRAAVPSGASTGSHEAMEVRDADPKRFGGKGVLRAVANVEEIIGPALAGIDALDQRGIDRAILDLDESAGLSRLGANAALGASLAVAHAAASHLGIPLFRYLGGPNAHLLPVPLLNLINGGAHARNALELQEFMVVPLGAASFSEAMRWGSEILHALRDDLDDEGLSTGVGDEGGFAPEIADARAALGLLTDAITRTGLEPGGEVALAIDPAASQLYAKGVYRFEERDRDASEVVSFYEDLSRDFPLVSIEDGLAEDDWDGWKAMTASLGKSIQLVGDDLFATNLERLEEGLRRGAANAILIKPNQAGTLTQTLDVVEAARNSGYATVVSHRSGETPDTSIADISVAVGSGQIKAGAPSRGERVAKYNRLLEIERILGEDARFAGPGAFSR